MHYAFWMPALLACNGDKTDGTTHSGDTTQGPPSFDFVTSVRAKSFDASIAPEVVQAHQASSAFLSAVAVAAADPKVQDRLASNGEGAVGGFRTGSLDCWARPQFPMFSFTLDYTGCDAYGMQGGIFVEDHPSGPLLFSFLDFQVTDRKVGGTVAFDTRDAYPEPMYWQLYGTDGDNPGLDNEVPIGLTVKYDSATLSFPSTYSGGANVDFLTQQLSVWGVLTTGPADAPITVVHGGVAPADVPPDDPRDADVLQTPLNWLACRCPTSGTSTYDMPMHFAEVTVDIDDLEVEPDDVDDPDLVIPVDFDLVGTGTLEHTGCGTYDVSYESEEAVIEIQMEQVLGVLTFACQTLVINDPIRCQALIDATRELEVLEVQVSKPDASATAAAAVAAEFDTQGYCLPY
jgi:hypothetical protein